MTNWNLYDYLDIQIGEEFTLGQKSFSENEIIEFAKLNDPLVFHLDKDSAAESFFGKLVCSGGQAFNFFYVNRWIPTFGSTVVGGLGIRNWDFLQAIGVDELIHGKAICKDIRQSQSNPMLSIVVWVFEFRDKSGTLAQSLEIKIFHKSKSQT